MRLRYLTLTLAAFTGPALAQEPSPEGEIYAAHGTEPFWNLTFEDGKIVFTADEERIEVIRPRPVTTRAGVHVYETPGLVIEISHEGRCNDGMSEYEYPDTVRLRFSRNQRTPGLEGCGGGILPPVTLVNTGWSIVDIDGAQVGGEEYQLAFDDQGRLSGRAGCNRISGPYSQQGRFLTAGASIAAPQPCPDATAVHERKLLELLGGPVRISFRGGMIMSLQQSRGGPGIFVTLRRQ